MVEGKEVDEKKLQAKYSQEWRDLKQSLLAKHFAGTYGWLVVNNLSPILNAALLRRMLLVSL